MIRISKLYKAYPAAGIQTDKMQPPVRQQIFADFDLELADGETAACMGASGSGKTTLLRLIAGLERADAGTVAAEGRIILSFHEERLIAYMNAAQNLRLVLPSGANRLPLPAERYIEDLLCAFFPEYDEISGRRAGEYSAGMKRRLSLARALTALEASGEGKKVLLLDEPFAGLDAETKGRTVEYVKNWKRRRQDITLLFTTHDKTEVSDMGARLILLPIKDGKAGISGGGNH